MRNPPRKGKMSSSVQNGLQPGHFDRPEPCCKRDRSTEYQQYAYLRLCL